MMKKGMILREWTALCHTTRKVMVPQLPREFPIMATHRDCVHNQVRAVVGRVLSPYYVPRLGMMIALALRVMILAEDLKQGPVLTLEETVETFPQNRRRRYRRTLQKLLASGWTEKFGNISAFVKSELLPFNPDKDPRMIQSRQMEFHLLFSRVTKPLEHSLYHVLDPYHQTPLVAKGMNLEQRYRAIKTGWDLINQSENGEAVSVSLDLSRWDMNVSAPMLRAIHCLYHQFVQCPLSHHQMYLQLANKCATDNGLTYRTVGGVMSGDMTTALGNCIAVIAINLLFRDIISALVDGTDIESLLLSVTGPSNTQRLLELGLKTELQKVRNLKHRPLPPFILDDGDDHIIIMSRVQVKLWTILLPVLWEAAGHKLTVEGQVEEFHRIQFCQHQPFSGTKVQTMVPNPLKVIPKTLFISGKYLSRPLPFLKTKVLARAILHNGVPTLGPLFRKLAREIPGPTLEMKSAEMEFALSGLSYQLAHKGLDSFELPKSLRPEPEDYVMLSEMFDIPVDQLHEWEEMEVDLRMFGPAVWTTPGNNIDERYATHDDGEFPVIIDPPDKPARYSQNQESQDHLD